MDQIKLRNAPMYAGVPYPAVVKLRNSVMYAAVQSPPVMIIRDVRAYALAEPLASSYYRNFRAYALVGPLPLDYLKMKGSVALLTAINKEHKKSITAEQVSFGDPTSITDPVYNSSVPMIAAPGWLYSGQMVFRYNRYRIDQMLETENPAKPAGTATTIHGRLAGINAAFGCNLEPRDVVDGVVAANTTGFRVTIASTSHLFIPGSSVVFGTLPVTPDLSSIGVSTLSGFTKVT